MDQQQREAHYAAEQAFLESLDKLQETLKPVESSADIHVSEGSPATPPANGKQPMFELDAIADAAADIERYLQSQGVIQAPESKAPDS